MMSSQFSKMQNYNDAQMEAVMGQRGQRVLPGQFVQHGSAELGNPSRVRRTNRSRERPDRADSMPNVGGARRGPAGVQERIEWTDALQDLQQKVASLQSSNRNLAQSFAHVEQVTRTHSNQLENLESRMHVVEDDYPKYKEYMQLVLFKHPCSVENKLKKAEAKLEDIANTNAELFSLQFNNVDNKIHAI